MYFQVDAPRLRLVHRRHQPSIRQLQQLALPPLAKLYLRQLPADHPLNTLPVHTNPFHSLVTRHMGMEAIIREEIVEVTLDIHLH